MNFHKVLIAVDDGPSAEKIAIAGFELGQQLNAEIALLTVVDTGFLMTEGTVTPKEMAELIKSNLIKNQQVLIEHVFKAHKVWTFTEEGKPADIVLTVAKEWEANLLVMGTHGRTGLAHLLMGSVAEQVLRHAEIPVFIVPAK